MPLSYTIDTERGIVRITAEGTPSIGDQAKLASQWMRDPAYRKGMPILLDNRLRTEPSDRTHVTEVAQHTARSPELLKGTRCAVVVANDAEFGMTRMFGSLSEERPLVTKPFRDIPSAEHWLTNGDD